MKQLLLILAVALSLYACSGPAPQPDSAHVNNTPLKTLKIDSTVTITSSELIADISVVRLESSWKNIIGHIDQMLFADDKIIVFDRYKAKAVYVFDRRGKFLNKIGMLGHGPQEYVDPGYIALIPGKNQVAVFDFAPKKVKIYELTGKYVATEDIPIYILSAEYLTDRIKTATTIGRRFLQTPEYGKASLFLFDKQWNVTFFGFQDPYPESLTYGVMRDLFKGGDRVYYVPPFEDRIYRIYPDSIQLAYQLDFGDRAFPASGKYEIGNDREFGRLLDKTAHFSYMADTRHWTKINIADNNRIHAYFYNKTTDSVYRLNRRLISNLLQTHLLDADFYCNDSCIVASVDASIVTALNPSVRDFAEKKPQSHSPELKRKIEDLSHVTENDNPVLFFYTLKNPQAKN